MEYWSASLPGAEDLPDAASMLVPMGQTPDLCTRLATAKDGRRVATAVLFPRASWSQAQAQAWLTARSLPTAVQEIETDEAPMDAERAVLVRELLRLQAATKAGTKTVKPIRVTEIKAVDEAAFEADVVISTGQIDRDREIIEPKGLYKAAKRALDARPIPLISSHDYSSLLNQIGDIRAVRLDGDRVIARARWYVGEGNKEADWGWNLATRKKVSAYSIGFVPNPMKISEANLDDERVREAILDGKTPLRTHHDLDLVETSQVLVPSNPGALGRMLEKGIITETDFLAVLNAPDIPRADGTVATPETPDALDFLGLKIAPAPEGKAAPSPMVDLGAMFDPPAPSPVTDGKGLLAAVVAEEKREEEAHKNATAAHDLWWAVMDLARTTVAEAAPDARLGLVQTVLAEFVTMVTPYLLAVANLTPEEREGVGNEMAVMRATAPAPQTVEVNAKALSLVLDQFQAKFGTLLTQTFEAFHTQLRAQTPTLPPIPADSLAFLSAKEVLAGFKDLAIAAATDITRAELRRELGDVDHYRRT